MKITKMAGIKREEKYEQPVNVVDDTGKIYDFVLYFKEKPSEKDIVNGANDYLANVNVKQEPQSQMIAVIDVEKILKDKKIMNETEHFETWATQNVLNVAERISKQKPNRKENSMDLKKVFLQLLLLCSVAYCASFTAAVSRGNWNDGATWGNSSPGTKGTDWPGTAADIFTIPVNDTVNYNVSETNELGASTINGALIFVTNANTLLTFGDVSLTVGATGYLQIGTSVNPVTSIANLVFNTTSDNLQGLQITSGGKYVIHGDSLYRATYTTTLANNAENTNADSILITNDNVSASWQVGDELAIMISPDKTETGYLNGMVFRTITAISGTTVAVSAVTTCIAGVGNTWVGEVVNQSRNVTINKYGAVKTIGNNNTNRPLFLDDNTVNYGNMLSWVRITGFYRVTTSNNYGNGIIIRNGYYGFHNSHSNTFTGNIYSCFYGFNYSYSNTFTGNIYSCYFGFNYSHNNTFTGNIYSCYSGVYYSYNNTFTGNIYSCYYGFTYSNSNTFTGKIGYTNSDVSLPNTNDISGNNEFFLFNCKLPAAGLVYSDRNIIGRYIRLYFEHSNCILNAYRIYDAMGDIIKTACDGTGSSPSVDPDGGHGDCIEVSNLQSVLTPANAIQILRPNSYRVWATASVSKTYTFKVQSTFTASTANDNLFVVGTYLSSAIDGSTTNITSTQAVATRTTAGDWTQTISVTINPTATGWVTFQIKLGKYESGKNIYIWPKCIIS